MEPFLAIHAGHLELVLALACEAAARGELEPAMQAIDLLATTLGEDEAVAVREFVRTGNELPGLRSLPPGFAAAVEWGKARRAKTPEDRQAHLDAAAKVSPTSLMRLVIERWR